MAKKMRIRRDGSCSACASALAAGTEALWDGSTKTLTCLACSGSRSEGPPPGTAGAGVVETPPGEPAAVGPEVIVASAGGSARREYERRSERERARKEEVVARDAAWRKATVEKRPVLGRVVTGLTAKPTIGPEAQTTTAWKVGAEGEERVAEALADVPGIEVLHDRKVPRSKANIDHLVVGPRGIFVIDAKKYKEGQRIEVRDVGNWRTVDQRLYLGGRDRTKLVEGVLWQVDVVRRVLGDRAEEIPVHGVLCFIGAHWGWRTKTKTVKGVTAVWPLGLRDLVRAEGAHGEAVPAIAEQLRSLLKPA